MNLKKSGGVMKNILFLIFMLVSTFCYADVVIEKASDTEATFTESVVITVTLEGITSHIESVDKAILDAQNNVVRLESIKAALESQKAIMEGLGIKEPVIADVIG